MKLLSVISRGVAIASLLVLVPACGPRYKDKSLKPLNSINSHFESTNNDITMRARTLTSQEAMDLFDGRGKKLFTGKKPARAIQIACANNSSGACQINNTDFALKSMTQEELYNELRFSGLQRALSIGIGGGLGLIGISSLERLNYFALTSLNLPWFFCSSVVLLGATISAGALLIPALTVKHVIESKHYNKKIKYDINSKVGNVRQIVDPHSQKDWLLNVKHHNFKTSFLIKVTDCYTNELTTFNIDLFTKK